MIEKKNKDPLIFITGISFEYRRKERKKRHSRDFAREKLSLIFLKARKRYYARRRSHVQITHRFPSCVVALSIRRFILGEMRFRAHKSPAARNRKHSRPPSLLYRTPLRRPLFFVFFEGSAYPCPAFSCPEGARGAEVGETFERICMSLS